MLVHFAEVNNISFFNPTATSFPPCQPTNQGRCGGQRRGRGRGGAGQGVGGSGVGGSGVLEGQGWEGQGCWRVRGVEGLLKCASFMSIYVSNYHNVMVVQSRTTVECRCVFGGIPGGTREGISANYTTPWLHSELFCWT